MLVAVQSSAIRSLRSLLGADGYRTYADALGRGRTTFHASVSKHGSTTSLLVLFGCRLLREAADGTDNAKDLLNQSSKFSFPVIDHRTDLEFALFCALGDGYCLQLSDAIGVPKRTVENAIRKNGARYAPHFRLYASTLVAIKKQGKCTSALLQKICLERGRGVAVVNG